MKLFRIFPIVALLGSLLLIPGCGQKPAPPDATEIAADLDGTNVVDEVGEALEAKLAERRRPGAPTRAKPKPTVAAEPARTPTADEQWCFQCEAKGTVPCRADGCANGFLPCPGACVRPGKGTWVPFPGRPGELGYKLPLGNRSSAIISLAHVGEIWTVQNGQAVSLGSCPTCHGNMKVRCRDCDGAARVQCGVCQGTKLVAKAWKPTDNPWFNAQPDVVRLRDGRVFLGKESGGDGESIIFKTRAGQFLTVPKSELVVAP